MLQNYTGCLSQDHASCAKLPCLVTTGNKNEKEIVSTCRRSSTLCSAQQTGVNRVSANASGQPSLFTDKQAQYWKGKFTDA